MGACPSSLEIFALSALLQKERRFFGRYSDLIQIKVSTPLAS